MLVLTPKPDPLECISGYLYRLSKANGYARPSWIIEPYRNGYHSDDYRRITPALMQEIASLTPEESHRVCVRPDRKGDRTKLRLVGIELHASHVDMRLFRICPHCVAEHDRHEAFWHLRMVEWCPIHRVRLLATCGACKKTLRWNRPSIGKCHCGADLTSQVLPDRCDERLAELLLVFRRALYGAEHVDANAIREMKHLLHMDLYRLMRMVDVLGDQIARRAQDRESDRYVVMAPAPSLQKVADALAPWSTAFHEFLHLTYDDALSGKRTQSSFRDVLSWAIYPLGKNLKEHAGQLSFLRDEVLRFGARYWTREQLMRGAKALDCFRLDFRWGSVPDAAEVLGLDPRTLLKHIHEGDVPVKAVGTMRRNRNYKVDLNWARSQRYSASPGVKIRDAAAMLGLSTPVLSMLQACRAYSATLLSRPPNTFATEDIKRFKEDLDRLAMTYSEDGTVGGILIGGRRYDMIRSGQERARGLHRLLLAMRSAQTAPSRPFTDSRRRATR